MSGLVVNAEQIGAFVQAVFAHASDGGVVSLRVFEEGAGNAAPLSIVPVYLNGNGLDDLTQAAVRQAQLAADAGRPAVFCPPLAAFATHRSASEADLIEGYTLSVELDHHAEEARRRLETVLGPTTLVVASGGEWANDETGAVEAKLHLHWRLSEPATSDDLKLLKRARRFAAAYVGADPTTISVVHPMRWPGSWHRKGEPRLAEIVARTDHEIEIKAALDLLGQVQPEPAGPGADRGRYDGDGDARPDIELIRNIAEGVELHPSMVPLAARLLGRGMYGGAVVDTIRGLLETIRPEKRDGRWQARWDGVPKIVHDGEAKFGKQEPKPASERNRVNGFTSEPLPLFPPPEAAEPYPVEALGPMAAAAVAIAAHIQVPVALAAQSVLAGASHAAQALRDVRLPHKQNRPLTLFLASIADSGGRKTSSDKEASRGTRDREQELRDEHRRNQPGYAAALAAYNAKKQHIERDKKLSQDQIRDAIAALVHPRPLLQGALVQTDVTLEGLAKAWPTMPASQALFTSEGGVVLDGAAMSRDLKTRSAGNLSQLWDGVPMSKLRAMPDGSALTVGKRLALHAMVQPRLAAAFLGDPELRDQGLLSRLLVAAPSSLVGSRLFRRTGFDTFKAIKTFTDRIHALLSQPWSVIGDNELHPDALLIPEHGEAEAAWIAYHDEVESGLGVGGRYAAIKDVGAKSAEQAARIAGIQTVFADHKADQVTVEAMRNGVTMARWFLGEALRLQRAGVMSVEMAQATVLLDWLRANPETRDSRNVLRLGPPDLRSKKSFDLAMHMLIDHGWVRYARGRSFVVWE